MPAIEEKLTIDPDLLARMISATAFELPLESWRLLQ